MYKIINDNETMALTETPNYVRLQDNGCFGLCGEPEAQGIVYNGTVYHLLGRPELEGKETVMLLYTDAGEEIGITNTAIMDADAMNVDQEYRLTLLELGISDL